MGTRFRWVRPDGPQPEAASHAAAAGIPHGQSLKPHAAPWVQTPPLPAGSLQKTSSQSSAAPQAAAPQAAAAAAATVSAVGASAGFPPFKRTRPQPSQAAAPHGGHCHQAKPFHPHPANTQVPWHSAAAQPNKRPKLSINNTAANIENELKQKERELEMLRKKMELQEQLRKQKEEQAKAHEAARIQQQQQQEEIKRKKASLKKGFNLAASGLVASATAAVTVPGSCTSVPAPTAPSVNVADATEVSRVLDSKNDYECLLLHVGASMAQVKKSYRRLAIALHPDKCRVEGASDAFQRINTAYNNLSKNG